MHRSIRERSLPAIKRLTHLWRRSEPPRLSVVRTAAGAEIRADGAFLLDALPGDGRGETPEQLARGWAGQLDRALHTRVAAAGEGLQP